MPAARTEAIVHPWCRPRGLRYRGAAQKKTGRNLQDRLELHFHSSRFRFGERFCQRPILPSAQSHKAEVSAFESLEFYLSQHVAPVPAQLHTISIETSPRPPRTIPPYPKSRKQSTYAGVQCSSEKEPSVFLPARCPGPLPSSLSKTRRASTGSPPGLSLAALVPAPASLRPATPTAQTTAPSAAAPTAPAAHSVPPRRP